SGSSMTGAFHERLFPSDASLRFAAVDSLEALAELVGGQISGVYHWGTFAIALRKNAVRPVLRLVGWQGATAAPGRVQELDSNEFPWVQPVLDGHVIVRDVQHETLFENSTPLSVKPSVLAVPLFHESATIGFLLLQSESAGEYD